VAVRVLILVELAKPIDYVVLFLVPVLVLDPILMMLPVAMTVDLV
jgi:hypothetical protein